MQWFLDSMEEECKPRVYKSEGDHAQDIVINDKEDVNRMAEDISATAETFSAIHSMPFSPLSNGSPSSGSSSVSSGKCYHA